MKSVFSKFLLVFIMLGFVSTSYATMGFLKREEVSGLNKICYYDVLGAMKTVNVPSHALCPVTYDF